jgi:hypothetical protein
MYQHFRNNLSVIKNYKSTDSLFEEPDENIFHQVLHEMPIPPSFRDSFKELKGIAVSVLAALNTQFGASGQHMLLIGRALRWSAYLKYGPLDWKTIKLHYYIEFFVSKCHVSVEVVEKFMNFELERKTKVDDHLKRVWNDFRNSALIFWDRSLRYPSHELTYGSLQNIYLRQRPTASLIPWPSPTITDNVILTMTRRYVNL